MEEVKNLPTSALPDKKFDFEEDLQLKVLQLVLQDYQWGRSVGLEIVEGRFFDNVVYEKIFNWAKFLMEKYNAPINKATLKDCASRVWYEGRMSLSEKPIYDQAIESCFKELDLTDGGLDYIKERALDFAKKEKFAQALRESTQLLQKDPSNYEKSLGIMQKALGVGSGLDMGLDLMRDFSNIPTLLSQKYDKENMISTGLRGLDEVIGGGWIRGTLSLVGAPPGAGKAISVKTPVLTPDGWVEAGTIKEGDYLIARNGTPTQVKKVFPQGVIKNLKVTLNDGSVTNCCPDHLWEVMDNANKKVSSVCCAKDLVSRGLKHGKRNRWSIPMVEPVQFDAKDLPLHPYILGVLMTTAGSIMPDSVKVCVPTFDNSILIRIKELLPAGVGLVPVEDEEKPSYYISNPQIVNDALMSLSDYKFASVDQRMALLQGLMDVDGLYNKDTANNKFFTTIDLLKNFVVELVQSLGGIAVVESEPRAKDSYSYVITIKINQCPFLLPRKMVNWKAKKIDRSIEKIESQEDTDSVCFLVDNDEHLFVIEHYIVTHNTRCMSYFAAEAMRQGKKVVFISLELDEIEILANLASSITNITWWDMVNENPDKVQEFQDASKRAVQEYNGANTKVKFYVNKSISSQQIITYLMRLKSAENFVPDLIVVDYMDLLLPIAGAGSKGGASEDSNYDILGTVCFDLIRVAKTFNVPVVSGTQLGRGAWDLTGKEVISMASVSESAKKAFNAHNLITINRNGSEKELGKARFYTAKARTGCTGSVVYTDFNLGVCHIREVEPYDPSDGPETEVTVKQTVK